VLDDISFDLLKGETLGVIGRNGAGKSTLLRLLAGIIQPNSGNVVNHDQRSMLLALNIGLNVYLTGRENAIISGMILGISRQKMLDKMDSIVSFAELESVIDDPVYTYSSGMRARLGFSVAFHADTDVILIDEVMGVGDAAFRKKSKQAMNEKIGSGGTFVIVSHQAPYVREMCDRAVWIEKGKLKMVGGAADLIEAYEDSV